MGVRGCPWSGRVTRPDKQLQHLGASLRWTRDAPVQAAVLAQLSGQRPRSGSAVMLRQARVACCPQQGSTFTVAGKHRQQGCFHSLCPEGTHFTLLAFHWSELATWPGPSARGPERQSPVLSGRGTRHWRAPRVHHRQAATVTKNVGKSGGTGPCPHLLCRCPFVVPVRFGVKRALTEGSQPPGFTEAVGGQAGQGDEVQLRSLCAQRLTL